jgi:hypothetical protein
MMPVDGFPQPKHNSFLNLHLFLDFIDLQHQLCNALDYRLLSVEH